MSSSLTKRRLQLQKENINRLSNSKIISAYSGSNLTKINCSQFLQPFLSINFEQKMKTNTKRLGRLKTGRKHQLSAQFILSNKHKQPYSVRNPHLESKTKQKKKKKDKTSHQSSKFIIPFCQFSKSNSLIVFSEKDSTISANLFNKEKNLFFSQKYTPSQAAVIIQKTWRGYLTRKLLDQYIADEETMLNSVIKRIRSKDESFNVEEGLGGAEQLHFSEFSSINEGTANINDLGRYNHQNEEEINAKYYPLYTTSQETSTKENVKCDSPVQFKSFFKNHKTQTEVVAQQLKEQISSQAKKQKRVLSIASSQYNYFFYSKMQQDKINQILENEPLINKIERVNSHIESSYKQCKKMLKQMLQSNQLELQEMIKRNNKLKDVYENSQIFLQDVLSEINAIVEDMGDIAQNGMPNESLPSSNRNEPKSQMFTIQMDENQPELPNTCFAFRDGQLKLQSYLNDLIEQYNQSKSQISELQFLCEILKVNSERGVKNIIERCLIQLTVEMITENFPLEELNRHIYKVELGDSKEEKFLRRWIDEISKWEMGTIQEVTLAMQSSSFINGETSKSFINQQR